MDTDIKDLICASSGLSLQRLEELAQLQEKYELFLTLSQYARKYIEKAHQLHLMAHKQIKHTELIQNHEILSKEIIVLHAKIITSKKELIASYKTIQSKCTDPQQLTIPAEKLNLKTLKSEIQSYSVRCKEAYLLMDKLAAELELVQCNQDLESLLKEINKLNIQYTKDTTIPEIQQLISKTQIDKETITKQLSTANNFLKQIAHKVSIKALKQKNVELLNEVEQLTKHHISVSSALQNHPLDKSQQKILSQRFSTTENQDELINSFKPNFIDNLLYFLNIERYTDPERCKQEELSNEQSLNFLLLLKEQSKFHELAAKKNTQQLLKEEIASLENSAESYEGNSHITLKDDRQFKSILIDFYSSIPDLPFQYPLNSSSPLTDFYVTLLQVIPFMTNKFENTEIILEQLSQLIHLHETISSLRMANNLSPENDNTLPHPETVKEQLSKLKEQKPQRDLYKEQFEYCDPGLLESIDQLILLCEQKEIRQEQKKIIDIELKKPENKPQNVETISLLNEHFSIIKDSFNKAIEELVHLSHTHTEFFNQESAMFSINAKQEEVSSSSIEHDENTVPAKPLRVNSSLNLQAESLPIETPSGNDEKSDLTSQELVIESKEEEPYCVTKSNEMNTSDVQPDLSAPSENPDILNASDSIALHSFAGTVVNESLNLDLDSPEIKDSASFLVLADGNKKMEQLINSISSASSEHHDMMLGSNETLNAEAPLKEMKAELSDTGVDSPIISENTDFKTGATSNDDVFSSSSSSKASFSSLFQNIDPTRVAKVSLFPLSNEGPESSQTLENEHDGFKDVLVNQNSPFAPSSLLPSDSRRDFVINSDNSDEEELIEHTINSHKVEIDSFSSINPDSRESRALKNNFYACFKLHQENLGKFGQPQEDNEFKDWYNQLYNALKKSLQEIPACYQATHLINDINFELRYKNTDVLRIYQAICPNPIEDFNTLLSFKPSLPIDANFTAPRKIFDQNKRLLKNHPKESELYLQATKYLLSIKYDLEQNGVTKSNSKIPSILKDPRYQSLQRHRGVGKILEGFEDLINTIKGLITGQAKHEYTNRPCSFFQTKSTKMIMELETSVNELYTTKSSTR